MVLSEIKFEIGTHHLPSLNKIEKIQSAISSGK